MEKRFDGVGALGPRGKPHPGWAVTLREGHPSLTSVMGSDVPHPQGRGGGGGLCRPEEGQVQSQGARGLSGCSGARRGQPGRDHCEVGWARGESPKSRALWLRPPGHPRESKKAHEPSLSTTDCTHPTLPSEQGDDEPDDTERERPVTVGEPCAWRKETGEPGCQGTEGSDLHRVPTVRPRRVLCPLCLSPFLCQLIQRESAPQGRRDLPQGLAR